MNKNELEYRKALLGAERFNTVVGTIRHVVSAAAVLGALWLIFDGLHKVIGGQSADGIGAFAKVVEALNLGSIVGYIWGGGATAVWWRERKGKQRIIREKRKLQQMVEQQDPNRTSSGLTDTGATPCAEAE